MGKYREVPVSAEAREGEPEPETTVLLHFMRHEAKESVPGKPDTAVELTVAGRQAAIDRGEASPAAAEVSWAGGSDRIRSAHTALLRMVGKQGGVTADMDYAAAKAAVEAELAYGQKVTNLPELNFYFDGTPEFSERGMGAYKAGRGLEFFLNESDELARELGDKESLSYSRVAANYASLIAREMQVGNNFNRLVGRKPDEYAAFGNRLERFFGTHQTVSECFYMKVLEKTKGRRAADEFIDRLRDKDGKVFGFDFQEGIDVEIRNGAGGQRVVMRGVRGLPDIELTPELLGGIIGDAEELDKEIAEVV